MRTNFFIVFLTFLFSFATLQINAQSNTTKSDSLGLKKENLHSPKKAAWMSAALPGLGQAYNKKYWKIPIVYAALGTVTYLYLDNHKNYIKYRDGYISRIDSDTTNDFLFPDYTTENLREIKNLHWRYRDLNAFIFVGIWALNILDAVVDAHLYTFDIGEDLTLQVHPAATLSGLSFGSKPSVGVSFSLFF